MDAPLTEQKPSAEVQAVVMQLWNVVRETSQASAGAVSERNVLAKKYATAETTLQQEAQKSGKMQAYIEHLQEEATVREEEFTKLQQQYRELQEMSRHREETIQELRRSVMEQEERVAKLNTQIQEQARNIAARVSEIVAQEDELEQLREELGASNERAMASAQELGELQPLYIELQEEKVLLTQETAQLRWQLTAVTEQTAHERTLLEAEQDRKLTDAHAENGRLLVEMEEFKRLWNESDQRIRVLESDREEATAKIENTVQQAQQDTLAWQQIAEEQEQTFTARERALREELAATSNDSHRVNQLQHDLQAAQNLLLLEKIAHDQTLQTVNTNHAQEHEIVCASLRTELDLVRSELVVAHENAKQQRTALAEAHSYAMKQLQHDLEASQKLMDEEQMRIARERELLEQYTEQVQETQAKLIEQQQEQQKEQQEQQKEQQARFDEALEQYKREAQIRLEMELDVTRHVLSMKDREIQLLRTNIEALETKTSRAELENALEAAPYLSSRSNAERIQLAGKVRQMLSQVESALEEEVQ
jgi:hypothetical protein